MPRMKGTFIIGGLVALFVASSATYAQPNFKFTKIVDPNGNPDANFVFIHDAIDAVPDDTSDKYTILVYAGTYTIDTVAKLIELDDVQENIDIVGIDRESVIIDVTIAGSGIKITSGTETSRNNRISNLTIITSDGHGIEIVKGTGGGDKTPEDITIEGVTIHADGSGMEGVTGKDATHVSLLNCDITSNAGNGIEVGDDWTLTQVIVDTTEDANIDQHGIVLVQKNNVTIVDSDISGEAQALHCFGFTNALVVGCRLFTPGGGGVGHATVYFARSCTGFVFQNCLIISDATASINDRPTPHGVFTDVGGVHNVLFQSCTISAVGDDVSLEAVAVRSDVAGTMRFVGCDLSATNKPDAGNPSASAKAVGVRTSANVGPEVVLIGGSITTSSTKCKETEVWDLERNNGVIEVFGTDLSKWFGPINSAGRPRSVIQRTIDVGFADDDGILEATGLTGSEQPNVTPDFQPDVYRVLSVTGNKTGMFQNVYIIGTDWADNVITEKIQLDETTPREGFKPFKTVDHIILPAENGAGETVTVGTTYKLGLYYPIASTSAVLQQGKKQSGATSYTLESIGPVDATYSTVEIVGLVAGDESFEWAILASQ